MRKLALFLLVTVFSGFAFADTSGVSETPGVPPASAGRDGLNVLVFVAQRMYREEPLEGLRSKFAKHGIGLVIAAPDTAVAVGMNRTVIRPDMRLRDADPADFDMLVLNGGSGGALYWDDSVVHAKVREFADAGTPLAAIGIAPVTLAKAGVLEGRAATVFQHRAAVTWLKESGAKYSFAKVVVDRNVVTAADTEHTKQFVDAVLRRLGVRD